MNPTDPTAGSAPGSAPATNRPDARVGQLWRDQEGLVWRVVAAPDGKWFFVKRHGYPHTASIQTLRAWLREWELVSP